MHQTIIQRIKDFLRNFGIHIEQQRKDDNNKISFVLKHYYFDIQ